MEQDNFPREKLYARTVHRIYLVTYSQADMIKVPSPKDSGRLVKNFFYGRSSKIKVINQTCCLEEHQGHGQHYHLL